MKMSELENLENLKKLALGGFRVRFDITKGGIAKQDFVPEESSIKTEEDAWKVAHRVSAVVSGARNVIVVYAENNEPLPNWRTRVINPDRNVIESNKVREDDVHIRVTVRPGVMVNDQLMNRFLSNGVRDVHREDINTITGTVSRTMFQNIFGCSPSNPEARKPNIALSWAIKELHVL